MRGGPTQRNISYLEVGREEDGHGVAGERRLPPGALAPARDPPLAVLAARRDVHGVGLGQVAVVLVARAEEGEVVLILRVGGREADGEVVVQGDGEELQAALGERGGVPRQLLAPPARLREWGG